MCLQQWPLGMRQCLFVLSPHGHDADLCSQSIDCLWCRCRPSGLGVRPECVRNIFFSCNRSHACSRNLRTSRGKRRHFVCANMFVSSPSFLTYSAPANCSLGHVSSTSREPCIPCVKGFYMNHTSGTLCDMCPTGKYTPVLASSNISECVCTLFIYHC